MEEVDGLFDRGGIFLCSEVEEVRILRLKGKMLVDKE